MKPLLTRGAKIVFWVLFASVGTVLMWRYLGNPVSAGLVTALVLLMGIFGLIVFISNMRDAKAGWHSLFAERDVQKPKVESPPESRPE